MEPSTFLTMLPLTIILLLQIPSIKGAYFRPTAHTFPDGLQSVNGSSSTGGCQPESCVMMPIGGTTINGCDCPGTTPVNGSLIDGVIPSIDTTQQGWASELFTVNRNGRDSIIIGFEFSSGLDFRRIVIALFHCPILGIGATGVKVYSSFIFPAFISAASTLLVTHSSLSSSSCQSLSTVSIPIQSSMEVSHYFTEFLFTGGSSINPLNWLHLGEIRFSNEATTTVIPTTLVESSESITSPAMTLSSLEATTTYSSTINGDESDVLLTSTQLVNTMSATSTDRPTNTTTTSSHKKINIPPTIAAISVPVFIGTLIGVFAVLMLLTVIIVMLCVYIKRGKVKRYEFDRDTEYDDVIEKAIELSGAINPIEMKANEAYGTHQQDSNTILETPSMEVQYEELQ